MNIRMLVLKKAKESYPGNLYVEKRLKKELDYLEKNRRFEEIEIILKIKERIKDQNIYVFPTSLLSMYLLDLDFINPMPAHYYNEDTKEVIFEESKLYGVDLPKKEGFHRDGFNITEDYILNTKKGVFFELYLCEEHKDIVKKLVSDKFNIEIELMESENGVDREKISFGGTSIIFDSSAAKEFFGTNLSRKLNTDDFLKFIYEDFIKREFNINLNNQSIDSFKDIVDLEGFLRSSLTCESIDGLDFKEEEFPKTREDIFIYFRNNGYSAKDSAEITREISFGKNPDIKIKNDKMIKYFKSILYIWPKAAIVSIFIRDYFKRCI